MFASIAPRSLSAPCAALDGSLEAQGPEGVKPPFAFDPLPANGGLFAHDPDAAMVYTASHDAGKTERSNCRFVIRDTKDGKPQILVERYHQTVAVLSSAVLGFDLLGGTTLEQAKKVVAALNENVLDVFVTVKQTDAVPGT